MDTQLQDLYVNEGLLGKGAYGVVYRYGFMVARPYLHNGNFKTLRQTV